MVKGNGKGRSANACKHGVCLGANTIRRAEAIEGVTSLTVANERALRQALESSDVKFVGDNRGGAGLRFRERGGRAAHGRKEA